MKQTFWNYLNLPFDLDKILFTLGLVLILSTFLGGYDFGIITVPKFNDTLMRKVKKLRIPIALMLVSSLIPIIPTKQKTIDKPKIPIHVEDQYGNTIESAIITIEGNSTFIDTSNTLGLIQVDSTELDRTFIVRHKKFRLFREKLSGNVIMLKK